jgi:hypothetical protein
VTIHTYTELAMATLDEIVIFVELNTIQSFLTPQDFVK